MNTPKHLGQVVLGKYRLEQVLDVTPLGCVYRAIHLAMDRPVEFTLVDLSREWTPEQRTGFQRQAGAASRLEHTGVARIYDFGRHNDEFLYRVEERIEGTTLHRLCGDGGVTDIGLLLDVMIQATEILDKAHARGLYHLRLSPSALAFADDEVSDEALRIRHFAGVPWGTRPEASAYAAPEQFTGTDVGPRADIYSAGLIVWFVVVGAPAVMGTASIARHAHLSDAEWRVPPNADCPPELAEVIHTAAAKSPDDRYASMFELGRALKRARESIAPTDATSAGSDTLAQLGARTPFPLPGDLFGGKYEIERMIGSGGFARVYAAHRTSDGQRVAVKVLWHGAATSDAHVQLNLAKRFEREARVASMLQCANTVSVYDFGTTDTGLAYQVLEFIDGIDLDEWLAAHGKLELPVVVDIVRQVLQSLQEAHGHGILHRDIKPANIMVRPRGDSLQAKVVDFGIAKVRDDVLGPHQTQLTTTGTAPGTPRYMPPEQLQGEPLGPPSDLYSLGLVIYELLTGDRAIRGESTYEIAANHLAGDAITLPVESVPDPGLRRVFDTLLRKAPKQRHQSAGEVLEALKAY